MSIYESHRPNLAAGTYVVRATQTTTVMAKPEPALGFDTGPDGKAREIARFDIAGPAAYLQPQDVTAVYPADGARGHFEAVIPHVVLEDSMLPWAWTLDSEPAGSSPPWLALILLGEADPFTIENRPDGPNGAQKWLHLEGSDVDAVLPQKDQLHLLAHVRADADQQRAIVLCNRLCVPGQGATLALVSVRAAYADDRPSSFPVLGMWRFSCLDGEGDEFTRVFKGTDNDWRPNLSASRLAMAAPEGDPDAPWTKVASAQLARGHVALAHARANGQPEVSWYRGPLMPHPPTDRPKPDKIPLPEDAAELVVPHQTSGLSSAGYATAWSLGRHLAVRDRAFCTAMLAWRRSCRQSMRRATCAANAAHLPALECDTGIGFPVAFFERLARLDGVPLRYLLPAEQLLPVESLRLFAVDPVWIYRLLQGAFSIGREACRCKDMEGAPLATLARLARLGPDATPLGGIILRSHVVTAWPELRVTLSDGTDALPTLEAAPRRCAPDMMMVLAEGVTSEVTFERADAMAHFEPPSRDNRLWLASVKEASSSAWIAHRCRVTGHTAVFTFTDKMAPERPEISLQ